MRSLKICVVGKHPRCAVLLGFATLASIGQTSAVAQMTEAEVYEFVIKPQEEKRAADTAAILARPSNWGPGEIRSNGNYGGITWYKKPSGDYGYIVARGYISPTSAKVQMDIECYERKVACEGTRMLNNEWLVIGKRTEKVHFVTASAQNRKDGEVRVLAECKKDGGACVIQDAFDVMAHKRGISHLRPKVTQR